MVSVLKNAVLVDKSSIPAYRFPKDDLLLSVDQKKDILIKLKVATILGNLEKIKCRIIFKDNQNVKAVETTIWATCEKNIVLKSGVFIPINRLIDVLI